MYFLPIHNPTSQQRRGFLASRKMTGSVHAATINIDNGFIYFSQFFSGGRLTDLLVLSVLSIFTLTKGHLISEQICEGIDFPKAQHKYY